jgi:ABC-type nickel/cobalt efflux system permease component RcnA
MNTNNFAFFVFATLAVFAGCTGNLDPEAERQLAKAAELHEQGLTLEAEVASQLNALASRPATDSLLAPVLTRLQTTLAWVRENRVEVPGHEHHHHHGDGHDHHHHAPPASLSPADQVLLQQELLDSLLLIKNQRQQL